MQQGKQHEDAEAGEPFSAAGPEAEEENLHPPPPPLVSASADELNEQGTAFYCMKKYSHALDLFTSSLKLQEQRLNLGSSDADADQSSVLDFAATLNNIAMVYSALGRSSDALAHFYRSLSYEKDVIPDSAEVAQLHVHIATILSAQGEYIDALQHFHHALSIEQKISPSGGGTVDIAAALANIGLIEYELGNYQAAVKELWRSIDVYQELAPSDDVELEMAANYFSLGLAYLKLQQHDEALVALCMNCLETREALAPNSPQLAETYDTIASVYVAQNRLDRALDMLIKELPIVESCFPFSAQLVQMYNKVAVVMDALGRSADAAEMKAAADELSQKLAASSGSGGCSADLSICSGDEGSGTSPSSPRKKKKKQSSKENPLEARSPSRYPRSGKGMRASDVFPNGGGDEKVNPVTMLTLFSLWKKLPHKSAMAVTTTASSSSSSSKGRGVATSAKPHAMMKSHTRKK